VIHRSMSLRDAFAHLYSCRSCVWPNDGFMASLVALELQVRGTSTITTIEYEHWGEYEGPELPSTTGGMARALPLPMGMPRMNRDDTCLEDEIRELAIAEALVASEHTFAIKLQRQARLWLRRRQHAIDEPGPEPTSPSTRRPRRVSISKLMRRSNAAEASNEARKARALRRSSLFQGSRSGRRSLSGVVLTVIGMLRLTKVAAHANAYRGKAMVSQSASGSAADVEHDQDAAEAEVDAAGIDASARAAPAGKTQTKKKKKKRGAKASKVSPV